MENFQIFKAGKIICNLPVSCLVGFWDRNSVAIILNNKEYRESFYRCTINCFINVPFRDRRFTLRTYCNTFNSILFNSSCNTYSMKSMISCTGRGIMNIPFRFCKVIRHVPSSTGHISSFGYSI